MHGGVQLPLLNQHARHQSPAWHQQLTPYAIMLLEVVALRSTGCGAVHRECAAGARGCRGVHSAQGRICAGEATAGEQGQAPVPAHMMPCREGVVTPAWLPSSWLAQHRELGGVQTHLIRYSSRGTGVAMPCWSVPVTGTTGHGWRLLMKRPGSVCAGGCGP